MEQNQSDVWWLGRDVTVLLSPESEPESGSGPIPALMLSMCDAVLVLFEQGMV